MRGILLKLSLFIVIPLSIISCSKGSIIRETLDNGNNTITVSNENNIPKDIMKKASPEVKEYYDNLKTVIYAVGAISPDNKTRSLNTSEENPIISKLESLVDEILVKNRFL